MTDAKTERRCAECNHSIDFRDSAEAERFTTSSKWVETDGRWTCPVCVYNLANFIPIVPVHQDHPVTPRAPRYTPIVGPHAPRKAPLA